MEKEPNVLRLWCLVCENMEDVLVHLVDPVKFTFTCLTCGEYVEVYEPKKETVVQ